LSTYVPYLVTSNSKQAINSNHNGFPVVFDDGPERTRSYHGIILKKQLLILLDRQLFHGTSDSSAGVLDHEYISLLMNHKPIPLEQLKLPSREVQSQLVVDVRPCKTCDKIFLIFLDMDRSQVVAQTSFHFTEVYNLFKGLGLRHLPVVDEKFQVVGMITRHDLLSWNFENFNE
jgi:CBS domain-containing protein